MFVPCGEEILAVCREQDLDNGLGVRLHNGSQHLAGQHTEQVDRLVLTDCHQLTIR